jgi:hypothetical protein
VGVKQSGGRAGDPAPANPSEEDCTMKETTNTVMNKSFTRLLNHKDFMSLIKEARRVNYDIEGENKDFYQVKDDQTGDLVFSGFFQGKLWIVTFFTLYWKEEKV